jgi:uncharacterized protein (DUF362 family)
MQNASTLLFEPRVAVFDTQRFEYPENPPFHPPAVYPEYPFTSQEIDQSNYVYAAVRQLFVLMKLDLEHFETSSWNPLGVLIHPGDNIVLKPNLVISDHPDGLPGIQASVVHGSIIRSFLDYILIANKGQGNITIADSPIKEVDFKRVLGLMGIQQVVDYLNSQHHTHIEIVDFRDFYVDRDQDRVMTQRHTLAGDSLGYRIIDLGQKSMLAEISDYADRYRSTAVVYENVMRRVHNRERNLYSIPNHLLRSDVVISFAKFKTHRKAGVTLSLKNMVGITNEKRWLPHHRVGSPKQGGDLFADDTRLDIKIKERAKDVLISSSWGRWAAKWVGVPLLKIYQSILAPLLNRHVSTESTTHRVEDGDWYGNDTVWRMVLDLNTLLLYANKEGEVCREPQRRYFSVVDGIIGGMEEGPLKPKPLPCGVLAAGFNPVAVDIVCARMMGFDVRKVPLLMRASKREWLPLGLFRPEDIHISTNLPRWEQILSSTDPGLKFTPSRGWQGKIEIDSNP